MSSLFESLVGPPSAQEFAATAVSRSLIKIIAEDVCAFRRNTQVSYRVVEQYAAVRFHIEQLIQEVEESDANDEATWAKYDTYADSIDPLDDALFALVLKSETEKAAYLPEFKEKHDSIQPCVDFSTLWEQRRKDLRDALTALRTKFSELLKGTTESSEDLDIVYKHDDTRYLSDIITHIKKYELQKMGFSPSTAADTINRIYGALNTAATMFAAKWNETDDASRVMVVKSAILIYGIMEYISNEDVDAEQKARARNDVVWKAAEILVAACNECMNGQKPTDQVVEAYNKLIELLGLVAGLPANFIELRKYTGKIGRSYHSQALFLIRLCRDLADHFEKKAKTAKNLESLSEAIDTTMNALKAAVTTDAKIIRFELDKYDTDKTVQDLSGASTKIKKCFEDFGLATQWTAKETELQAHVKNDKQRIEQVNQRIMSVDMSNEQTITVTLTVHDGDTKGTPLGSVEFTVRPLTRLSAIQWQASKHKSFAALCGKILHQDSYFAKKEASTDRVSLHDEIQSLSSGNSCDLILVTQPPPPAT